MRRFFFSTRSTKTKYSFLFIVYERHSQSSNTWVCCTPFCKTISNTYIQINTKAMTSSSPVTTVASKVHNPLFSGSNPSSRWGLISEMMGAIVATTGVSIFWAGGWGRRAYLIIILISSYFFFMELHCERMD